MKVKSKIGAFWIAALIFMAFCTFMMLRLVIHQKDIALDVKCKKILDYLTSFLYLREE